MNKAEQFIAKFTEFLQEYETQTIEVRGGIVYIEFDDGSRVDFTDPQATTPAPPAA